VPRQFTYPTRRAAGSAARWWIKKATISHSCGKWFVSIQTEHDCDLPLPIATAAIRTDRGIARFATMSDGNSTAPLNRFKKRQQRLSRYQPVMSRKVEISSDCITQSGSKDGWIKFPMTRHEVI